MSEGDGVGAGGGSPAPAAGVVGVAGVSRRYGATVALDGVSLGLAPGVTVLLGRNGAGKSTLCRVLAGAERPDEGHVSRGGRRLDDVEGWREHRRRCGWLPQAFGAPSGMTVTQFLEYAAWLKEVPRRRVAARVAAALEAVDLVGLRRRRLGALSGGMWRRVGIAQAIVADPDVLVLDEPTVGLDPEQRAAFHELLPRLGGDRTVLLSTHLLEDVVVLGERTVVLDAGSVRFAGETGALAALGQGEDVSARLRSGFLAVVDGAGGGAG